MKSCQINKLVQLDKEYLRGRSFILGADEAGRGAVAGPVVAGAVLIKDKFYASEENIESLSKLNDSKMLSDETRKELFNILLSYKEKNLLDFECAFASEEEVELLNILGATKLAFKRAIDILNERNNLNLRNTFANPLFEKSTIDSSLSELLIDGKPLKNFYYRHHSIVKGDSNSFAIAAASIIAKVSRDNFMENIAKQYPHYAFEQHKGYGTQLHVQRLKVLGMCKIHRKSFVDTLLGNEIPQTQQDSFF